MFELKRILVPYDFTDVSEAALSLAVQLACYQKAELHLLFVEPNLDRELKKRIITAPRENVIESSIQQNEQALLDAASKQLQKFREKGNPGNLTPTTHVIGGNWYSSVMNLVDELDIDTMVVGTHGRRGLKESLIGTETEEWVRKAPCSVLVVKPQGYPYLRD